MEAKLDVIRALTSFVARRALLFITIIGLLVSIALLVGIWALAYYFSGWWWLLLFIYIPWVVIAFIIFMFARFIIRTIYPRSISARQASLLKKFTDKIKHLLESRGMGWWLFIFLCFKDLLFYRDLRIMKALIQDTTSLKRDFDELERAFAD